MSRAANNNSIVSQRNAMNLSKKTTPPRTTDSTYTVNNNKSSSGSSGVDIVKNIEDVIARNKILEEENNVLRSLIHEESDRGEASLDERRILMLKCQIYQLEKQVSIFRCFFRAIPCKKQKVHFDRIFDSTSFKAWNPKKSKCLGRTGTICQVYKVRAFVFVDQN